jgi:adenylosuccinate synthase
VQKGRANIVIDGQAGSCGKGKTAAYLALRHKPHAVVACFGPNAGHTVLLPDGRKFVFRHLPAGSVHQDAAIYIGAAASIDIFVLRDEIGQIESNGIEVRDRLHIHPRAVVITDEDKDLERLSLQGIASTMKGVGAAQARKVMRSARLAQDETVLAQYVNRWQGNPVLDEIEHGRSVLVETSQGFDLCINHGIDYPRCTSRQINAAQALADLGLPPGAVGDVYGVIRPYPIRVGNITEGDSVVGFSGPYADAQELMWDQVARSAGMPLSEFDALLQQEKTTVTGRLRRVFTFSWKRFRAFCCANRPTQIVLNFADQISWSNREARDFAGLSERTRSFIDALDNCAEAPTRLIGVGPRNDQVVDLISREEEASRA